MTTSVNRSGESVEIVPVGMSIQGIVWYVSPVVVALFPYATSLA